MRTANPSHVASAPLRPIGAERLKVAKPQQDMRFDVPVVGVRTIETMRAADATCLAIDAGKCLLIDGEQVIEAANAAGICVLAD